MSLKIDSNNSCSPKNDGDTIGRFFQRAIFLSFTIGVPFCIFKLLFGTTAIRTGRPDDLFLTITGGIVIVWALTDLMMNIGRSTLDLLHQPALFEFCIIAQAGRIFDKPRLFLAIDSLLTIGIICTMLWSGWITKLTVFESYLWYAATTLNLISLSVVAIYHEIQMTCPDIY
jgi:hypothetical protein